jgi:hypothetical protein
MLEYWYGGWTIPISTSTSMSSLWLDHGHAMHFIYISVSWYACSFSCTFVRLTRYRIVRWCPLYTCLTRNFPEPQGEDLQDRPPPHIDRQRTARNATGGQKKNRIRRKQIKHDQKKCQFLSMLLSLTFLSRVCFTFGWSKYVKISSKRLHGSSVKILF